MAMKIIEYYETENKDHWLGKISQSDWRAGKYLWKLLDENKLRETIGETARVLMLVQEDELISFCTLAPYDEIQPTDLSPWVGFVYTFPEYRGNRYIGKLLKHAERLAFDMGKEAVYISTDHIGLYEKFGYKFLKTEKPFTAKKTRGYTARIYMTVTDKDMTINKHRAFSRVLQARRKTRNFRKNKRFHKESACFIN